MRNGGRRAPLPALRRGRPGAILSAMDNPTTTNGKKGARRFLKFSLRSAFIVMTAICALSAVYVPIERQRQAVKYFRKLGGQVAYENCQGKIKNWLRRHLGNDFVSDVRFVNLNGSRISDDGLRHLANV